jgi:hypothetical protein
MGLAHNLLLTRKTPWARAAGSHGPLQAQADIIGRFNVKAGGPNAAAQSLSGGNLQKFIVGREIDAKPGCSSSRSPPGGGRGRGGADPGRDSGAARRGLRRAGGQRGVGRVV